MQILLNLLAGVSLLVWGTHIVRTGILRLYGSNLRRFLRRQRRQARCSAFFAGVGITALIQSSTATALIVAAFAGQGLIGTAQALAVMLGADVGTSLVTVVLSFDLSWLSPLLIFVGVVLFLARQSRSDRPVRTRADRPRPHHVRAAMDLGRGQAVVQAAGVKVIFASLTGDVLLDMLVAALMTILCYSSLAVVLLVADARLAARHRAPGGARARARRQSGQRPSRYAVDAELATGSAPGHARQFPVQADRLYRAGAVHGAGREAVRFAGPRAGPAGHAVPPRLQPHAAVAFIFFTAPIARIAERLLPTKPAIDDPGKPRHLDPSALATPTLAISCAAREALRIGDVIEQMLNRLADRFARRTIARSPSGCARWTTSSTTCTPQSSCT